MIQKILAVLAAWARGINREIGAGGVYVFGSLIHRNGRQFILGSSDVDLVVRFPTSARSALDRLHWLEDLHRRKANLESKLAALLNRDKHKPICSLVVPTEIEICGDLHKDHAVEFFSKNQFLDLLTGEKTKGIPGAGTRPITVPLAQQCFSFAQKKRNLYLDVTASRDTKFLEFVGGEEGDPLPKDIMRHAAIVSAISTGSYEEDSRYDVQFGLDYVTDGLYSSRDTDKYIRDLHDRVSRRRGARGLEAVITARDQIFLAEWIFDRTLEALERRRCELYVQEPIQDTVREAVVGRLRVELAKYHWRVDKTEWGQGCTNPAFNLELVKDRPFIPLRLLEEQWAASLHYPEDLQIFALTKARESSGDLFNDEKIRIASDFTGEGTAGVAIQKTDYFSSVMTDQIAWTCIRSRELAPDGITPKQVLWNGTSAFIEDSADRLHSRLKGLGEASISNQLGASTLAFSNDGHLMIVYQSDKNLQSGYKLAPSGSGSLDWTDVAASNASDLVSLVRYGAERELREECSLDGDAEGRRQISSKVIVIGFARMLHRGGKPEFYCLGRIDASSDEICSRDPERYVEKVLTSGVKPANWSAGRAAEEICRVCQDYRDKPLHDKGVRVPLSYPLEHALNILIEVSLDFVAAKSLDNFMREDLG